MQQKYRDEVFMLSDVALILDIPSSRVKNWTTGRPLRIRPAVRAYGSGSRNLYRIGDIYRIAIAQQMTACGATPRAIQLVLDALGSSVSSCVFALLQGPISGRNKPKAEIRLLHHFDASQSSWQQIFHETVSKPAGSQLVSVGAITATVDSLVDYFLKKHRSPTSSLQGNSGTRHSEPQTTNEATIPERSTRKMRGFN